MPYKSKRSIRSQSMQQRLTQKYKTRTAKNTKQLRRTMTKKAALDYKKVKKQLEEQVKIRDYALQEGNLEVYAYSNKILLVMLLNLMAHGTKKAVKMANKYGEKTGININEKSLHKKLNILPRVNNTVKSVQNSYFKPPSTSIAAGWRW